MQASQLMPLVSVGVVSICCFSSIGCRQSLALEAKPRTDVFAIAELRPFQGLDRPAVQFPHDLHTKAMNERNDDCTRCHLVQEDGRMSLRFMSLTQITEEESIDLYHDNCIACHKERSEEGAASGPIACGGCHRRARAYFSARKPLGFDKSLHYRHIAATAEKCEACHHLYDETTQRLVYEKGQEAPCRDCHREKPVENRSSFRVAAHSACIGCHRRPLPEVRSESSGPRSCEGCHDDERQRAIAVVESPPRLKRNQPDFVLLAAPEPHLEGSKWRTVPFSHVEHEKLTTSCRTCHHETLTRCSACHSLAGTEDAAGVTFQQAMHGTISTRSCVGCHEAQKASRTCAGCHARMTQSEVQERTCTICHVGPEPERLAALQSSNGSLEALATRPPTPSLSFAPDDVPESVTISVISKEYEPVTMPHGKIVEHLRGHIDASKIASRFHGHEDVVCRGCHHNSPLGAKPPLCENCHSAEFEASNPLKPGLRGAYHLQCLGCHEAMQIEKPKDCVGCHREKDASGIES